MPKFVSRSTACRRETALPPANGAGQISNTRCACGSETKKVYSKPVIRELSEVEALQLLGEGVPPKTWVQKC